MPPAQSGRRRPYPSDPRPYPDRPAAPADARLPIIEYEALRGLPLPVQLLATAAMLPMEVAVTSVRVLKTTEALLDELVQYLRTLRPAVVAMSEAYADGHFDPLFRTFDQIHQQSSSAMGVIWAPISAVRQAVSPTQPPQVITAPPPVPAPPPPVVEQAPPTMAEWLGGLGGLGGRMVNQAASLPGALLGSVPRPAAEPQAPVAEDAPARYVPVTGAPGVVAVPVGELGTESSGGWSVPLVPGPIRRLFGS
jgi:hypothetical protein